MSEPKSYRYSRTQISQAQYSPQPVTQEVVVVRKSPSFFWIIVICLIIGLLLSIILTALFANEN